jgi:hypothetical protein
MRSIAFIALGVGFILMAAGLFALTLRKPKELPANPNKSQLREAEALVQENRKMRLAAAIVAAIGVATALATLL